MARARHPHAAATLDLRHPDRGLRVEALAAHRGAPCELLGIELDGRSAGEAAPLQPEAYVRGSDLIATYPATPERASRVQAYWRLQSDAERLVVDVQVSVQTNLLDALPRVRLVTRTPSGAISLLTWPSARLESCPQGRQAWASGRHCILTVSGAGWRYAEMIHPEDVVEWSAERADSGVVLTHGLFDERLEKGVILRARLRGVLAAGEVDAATMAADAYRRFLLEPLPLST